MEKKRKKKGLNKKALAKCSLKVGRFSPHRLVCFSLPDEATTQNAFTIMEHYIAMHDGILAYRPASYYDPTGPQVLYAIVPDTQHAWDLLRCQAARYKVIGQKLERNGSIPPAPDELAESELATHLNPLMQILVGELSSC